VGAAPGSGLTIRSMDNPVLDVRSSPLLRLALSIHRFDPWNFYDGDSGYRHSADAHTEIDALIKARLVSIADEEVEKGLVEHDHWLRIWVPDRLEGACTRQARARVCAFTELHLLVDKSLDALDEVVMGPAKPSDPVFDGLPDLAASLSRDGLLPITVENIRQEHVGTNAAFWIGSVGLLPHPHLAPYRELLHVLAELATDPALTVSVAINPFITRPPDDGVFRLMEDQWYGLQLTARTLDSLDQHDTGSSFHAAGERSKAEELLHPLLGTHFDWRARNDDPADPVKRLYIQEVRPARDPRDEELFIAVFNRALHAERDTSTHQFTHVDGKTCRYRTDYYPPCKENPCCRCRSRHTSASCGALTGQ
jgi:hypothetical protein